LGHSYKYDSTCTGCHDGFFPIQFRHFSELVVRCLLKNISKFLYQAKTVDEKQVENWVTCACFAFN
jgi:hypothetical protein